MNRFPHATAVMHPVQDFKIGDRIVSLYYVDGRTPSAAYTMYWNDSNGSVPIQHAMTAHEVFNQLHQLLESEE